MMKIKAADLKPGDIVRLYSGNFYTVERIGANYRRMYSVIVNWVNIKEPWTFEPEQIVDAIPGKLKLML